MFRVWFLVLGFVFWFPVYYYLLQYYYEDIDKRTCSIKNTLQVYLVKIFLVKSNNKFVIKRISYQINTVTVINTW